MRGPLTRACETAATRTDQSGSASLRGPAPARRRSRRGSGGGRSLRGRGGTASKRWSNGKVHGRAQNSPCTKMIVLRWTIAWRISYWPAVNISESNEQPSKPRGRLTERSRENSLAEKDQKGPTVNDALPLHNQNGVDTRTAAQSDKRARELTMPSFVRSSARLSYYTNSITGNSSAHGWFPIDLFGLLLTQHPNPSLSCGGESC